MSTAEIEKTQPQGKERAIYEAVLCLTAQERDLNTLTVQEIADAAGVGKGTLYEYFSSKQEILRGAIRYCVQQELERFAESWQRGESLPERLDRVLRYTEDIVIHRSASYQLLEKYAMQQPADGCFAPGMGVYAQSLLEAAVRQGKAEGSIAADLPEEYCKYTLACSLLGYAHLCRHIGARQGQSAPMRHLAEYTCTACLKALAE